MMTYAEIMDLEKSEHRDINIARVLPLEMVRKDGTNLPHIPEVERLIKKVVYSWDCLDFAAIVHNLHQIIEITNMRDKHGEERTYREVRNGGEGETVQ
jgi:hypothetical protein